MKKIIFLYFIFFLSSVFAVDYGKEGASLGKSLGGYFSSNSKQKVIAPINTSTSGTTVDGSKTFSGQISCGGAGAKSFLDLSFSTISGGDISINAQIDRDLNGAKEYSYATPYPVSGVCSNGIVSCDSGTWNNCKYYKWGYNNTISLSEVSRPEMGGCYCINNSCGGLAAKSPDSILQSAGNGLTALMMQYNKNFMITKTNVTSTVASYWGQNAGNCVAADGTTATLPSVSPTTTYSLAGVEEAKISQSANPNSAYSVFNAGANNVDLGVSTTTCNITNSLSISTQTIYEPCSTKSWNGQLWCLLGQAGNFTSYAGNNKASLQNITTTVHNGGSLYAINDGHSSICDDDSSTVKLVYSGDVTGSVSYNCKNGVKSGKSTPIIQNSIGDKSVTISEFYQQHSGGGHDKYNIYILKTLSYTKNNFALVSSNTCPSGPDCKIKEEQVCDKDGGACVYTIKNRVSTGVTPPEICYTDTSNGTAYLICANSSGIEYVGSDGSTGSYSSSPSGFITKRTYECTVKNDTDFEDIKKSRLSINVTETADNKGFSYSGSLKNEDGSWGGAGDSGTINFDAPPQVQYCQVKFSDSTKEVVYSDGTNKATATTSTSTVTSEIRECTGDTYNVCPLKAGESIKQACGSINDMAEVVGTMEAANQAAKDMICSND